VACSRASSAFSRRLTLAANTDAIDVLGEARSSKGLTSIRRPHDGAKTERW
jgi:hypothetical protein